LRERRGSNRFIESNNSNARNIPTGRG